MIIYIELIINIKRPETKHVSGLSCILLSCQAANHVLAASLVLVTDQTDANEPVSKVCALARHHLVAYALFGYGVVHSCQAELNVSFHFASMKRAIEATEFNVLVLEEAVQIQRVVAATMVVLTNSPAAIAIVPHFLHVRIADVFSLAKFGQEALISFLAIIVLTVAGNIQRLIDAVFFASPRDCQTTERISSHIFMADMNVDATASIDFRTSFAKHANCALHQFDVIVAGEHRRDELALIVVISIDRSVAHYRPSTALAVTYFPSFICATDIAGSRTEVVGQSATSMLTSNAAEFDFNAERSSSHEHNSTVLS